MNIQDILANHKLWLEDSNTGKRADLGGADLGDANLRYANLVDANLRYANLRYANLRGADLRDANLRGANLRDADLGGANLRSTDLHYANLRSADLHDANLEGANLRYADLSGADLGGANLRGADLNYAIGNNKEIKSLQIGNYLVTYTKEVIQIGCQNNTIAQWENFTDLEILDMDGETALNWWNLNKHIILELAKREI